MPFPSLARAACAHARRAHGNLAREWAREGHPTRLLAYAASLTTACLSTAALATHAATHAGLASAAHCEERVEASAAAREGAPVRRGSSGGRLTSMRSGSRPPASATASAIVYARADQLFDLNRCGRETPPPSPPPPPCPPPYPPPAVVYARAGQVFDRERCGECPTPSKLV